MNEIDKKILKIVEYALKTANVPMLFKVADLLNRRGHSELVFKELMDSLNSKSNE